MTRHNFTAQDGLKIYFCLNSKKVFLKLKSGKFSKIERESLAPNLNLVRDFKMRHNHKRWSQLIAKINPNWKTFNSIESVP